MTCVFTLIQYIDIKLSTNIPSPTGLIGHCMTIDIQIKENIATLVILVWQKIDIHIIAKLVIVKIKIKIVLDMQLLHR